MSATSPIAVAASREHFPLAVAPSWICSMCGARMVELPWGDPYCRRCHQRFDLARDRRFVAALLASGATTDDPRLGWRDHDGNA